jgi:hypothetical protein
MVTVESSEVYLLNQQQCEEYWQTIDEMLDDEPELWNKWFSKEGILGRIRNQTIQAWVVNEKEGAIRACFLTQILVSELGKVLQVFWLKGELPDGALKCISLALDRFGTYHECYRLYVVGRKGWERRLQGLGAKLESITLSRPIEAITRN